MLVQLEHLRTPFIATANMVENLDPTAPRRFTIRAVSNPMTPAQARKLSKVSGRLPLKWPVHHGQAPGDFAVVRTEQICWRNWIRLYW
jgi:hypothetical protein